MKLIRLFLKTAPGLLLMGLVGLLSLIRSALRTPGADASRPEGTGKPRMRALWIVLATVVVLVVTGIAGAIAFVYAGVYDIAASRPHLGITQTVLTTLKRQSVKFRARKLDVPRLDDAALIQRGFGLYRQNCVTCHGAPGESRSRIGVGVNPNPPPLVKAVEMWTYAEIAWITTYGLKMAGMPAFEFGEEPRDIWALTAFVKRLNTLSPDEYRDMVVATQGERTGAGAPWLPEGQGWDMLTRRGDRARGEQLINQYGCTACHVLPGARGMRSMAGPPLTNWRARHYISGRLINNPVNLVRWVMDPTAVDPRTAMPDLDVSEEDAWAIAGYLYALDGSRR